jgi:dihydroorotate dehydrogenase
MDLYSLIRPVILRLPAEPMHDLAIRALSLSLWPKQALQPHPALQQKLWGLDFTNPIGLAAGFDKNAAALQGLASQGFGFVEAGTVTPRAQPGNPTPRLFRLSEDEAVINRFGFNNKGLDVFRENLRNAPKTAIIGANIGKNKDSSDAVADYVTCLRDVWHHAQYVVVNISSPNTQGLRDLQAADALTTLLNAMMQTRAELEQRERQVSHSKEIRHVPLLVKIAPDLDAGGLEGVAEAVRASKVDGVIVSNTTLARPDTLRSEHKGETGGLSGAPLFYRATETLAAMHKLLGKSVPLIGVGGIDSPQAAYAKIRAGASLVQVYSALVYQGFGLVKRIHDELPQLLAADGFAHIRDAVGVDVK